MDRINGADFIDLGGGKRGFRDEDLPTGTPGTVVTADWLNGTQEEVLGIIEASGLVPNAADRSQLAKAVQSGKMNFAVAGGTANELTATLVPAPSAYYVGMVVNLLIAVTNTGPATLNVNGRGAVPIITTDGNPLIANDLKGMSTLVYVGASGFVILNFSGSTEYYRGVLQLASAAETTAGTNTSKPASVARMAAMVQTGGWNFTIAGGTANALTASLTPAPTGLMAGMTLTLFVTTPNTGPATLNVNGLGAKGIFYSDSSPVVAGDVFGKVILIYDGGSWILANNRIGSELARGSVQLANSTEVAAGADLYKPASVARMAAATQAGIWNFAVPGGTANEITATLTPAPKAYYSGLIVRTYITTANTGAATLNVNGLGAKSILDTGWGPLAAGDLYGIVTLVYDGASFVLLKFAQAYEGSRGVVQLATAAESAAGTNTSKPASVARMASAVQSGVWSTAATSGTANSYTATLIPAITSYTVGMTVNLWVHTPNTGPSTLNINGVGAVGILLQSGQALAANDINGWTNLVYDGSTFRVANTKASSETNRGGVQLATPAIVTAGTDLTMPASVGRIAAVAQSRKWNWATFGGTANALTATLTPAPALLTAGIEFFGIITTTNTGAAMMNLNGLGNTAITLPSGAALTGGELVAGSLVSFIYSGTSVVVVSGASNVAGHGQSYFGTPGAISLTVAAGVTFIDVETWGAGAGGGGVGAGGNGSAGGGGAGGYARKRIPVTPGQVLTGYVGAKGLGGAPGGKGQDGGTTSLAGLITCTGGLGGSPNPTGNGGGGGTATGGDINSTGGAGTAGAAGASVSGGPGGGSSFGGAGGGGGFGIAGPGASPGGGGGGSGSAGANSGGNGADGAIYVSW